MLKKYSTILVLFINIVSFSQTNTSKESGLDLNNSKTINAYQEYFKGSRESLYLHLNKSSYLKGENLWFQGYAYNRQIKNLDSLTRNVKIGVYDKFGKLIDKRLFLSHNGTFRGQLEIDSTFTEGKYFLKAETNYMKNFKEDNSHIQIFEIIGSEQKSERQNVSSYDFQILPEGGQSVYGCNGILGVKIINNKGIGIKYQAVLLENDIPLIEFESNKFGHSKIEYLPKENNNYSISAKLPNGNTIKKSILDIKKNGLVLNVKSNIKDKLLININSNFPEDFDLENAKINIFIHQEGRFIEIPIQIERRLSKILKSIKKETLFDGVNTITLFIDNKPVAERLIFKRENRDQLDEKLNAEVVPDVNPDSLDLKLGFNRFKKDSKLSISILPENTLSYVKNQNISTAFLLDPFINGYIEDKTYYFSNPDRRVDYDLDLLLMIQGWSKYKWKNIFYHKINTLYERKDGLAHFISINERMPNRVEKFMIYETHNNSMQFFDPKDKKRFKLENRYPLKGEEIKFSYLTKKKESIRPNLVVSTPLNLELDSLNTHPNIINSISNLRKVKPEFKTERFYQNFKAEEMLDEVIVNAVSKKMEDRIKRYGKFYAGDVEEVDQELVKNNPTLEIYLNKRGYIFVEPRDQPFYIKRNTSRASSLPTNFGSSAENNTGAPTIFLDGKQLNINSHILLKNRFLSDFEEILIDRSGFKGLGLNKGGVIMFMSRETPLNEKDEKNQPYFSHKVKNGFEKPKEFYMPKYAFYKTEEFP